jgi:16S rRNA processing protein RimM
MPRKPAASAPPSTPVSPLAAFATDVWPDDAVQVGRIVGAHGLQGFVKVAPLSGDAGALLKAARWWLEHGLPAPRRYAVETRSRRLQGGTMVAAIEQVSDRTAAEAFKGATVYVRRGDFPPARDGEFYWVDLLGLAVVNRDGVVLGTVDGLLDNGAQTVLRVVQQRTDAAGMPRPVERLIPFVEQYVGEVSLERRRIEVDWGEDY